MTKPNLPKKQKKVSGTGHIKKSDPLVVQVITTLLALQIERHHDNHTGQGVGCVTRFSPPRQGYSARGAAWFSSSKQIKQKHNSMPNLLRLPQTFRKKEEEKNKPLLTTKRLFCSNFCLDSALLSRFSLGCAGCMINRSYDKKTLVFLQWNKSIFAGKI